ncbi:hypothetical protein OSB04_015097 [Centaurea solstitialis]|uniref:PGG domain-containing protein n=1 Tax=Centaurea solstitialis TaxID=347529 RepID=A0AA38TGL2_9ASTR|nr:hypothetical protein OSB04_015097 [Centaurea solstitialis]
MTKQTIFHRNQHSKDQEQVVAERLVPRINHIKKKKEAFGHARKVLQSTCGQIDNLIHTRHLFYEHTILEAAIYNAGAVFSVIFQRSRESHKSKNKDGYDSFQLAVIYRSEKIYNYLSVMGEEKNCYRTIKDSFENNMLHLAARLAPSHVLKRRTGAALQLQRELQWFEELKKFMHPSAITKQNMYGETPPEVFTREHENLVKEGETWMKTTAESCSITAALITTIVFAAAITVPGGNNQETGIPMFRKDIAFTIFAISDALSLFTSTSSLMVFLSILTTRFAEKDFLVSLPRRLIIGLCTLLLSITAMMVAFGATLYLLFSREKQWMVGPICGFSCLPILFFVTLQLPLIVDLYRSTYVPIFQKFSNSHFHFPFSLSIVIPFSLPGHRRHPSPPPPLAVRAPPPSRTSRPTPAPPPPPHHLPPPRHHHPDAPPPFTVTSLPHFATRNPDVATICSRGRRQPSPSDAEATVVAPRHRALFEAIAPPPCSPPRVARATAPPLREAIVVVVEATATTVVAIAVATTATAVVYEATAPTAVAAEATVTTATAAAAVEATAPTAPTAVAVEATAAAAVAVEATATTTTAAKD